MFRAECVLDQFSVPVLVRRGERHKNHFKVFKLVLLNTHPLVYIWPGDYEHWQMGHRIEVKVTEMKYSGFHSLAKVLAFSSCSDWFTHYS